MLHPIYPILLIPSYPIPSSPLAYQSSLLPLPTNKHGEMLEEDKCRK
jgi:hypothetical protein